MVAPKIVEKVRAELPPLKFSDEVLRRIGKIGEGAIIENIMRQKQASGAPLKRNKEVTIDEKIRRKHLWRGRVMSLIADPEKRRFVQGEGRSFRSRVEKNQAVVEPAPGEITDLVRWVQEGGNGRNRYTGWFALSKKQKGAVRAELRKWIREEFSKAPKKYLGRI